MRTLKPAYDHLIVSVPEKSTTTSGGIIIPDSVEVDQTELITSVVVASDDDYASFPEGTQVWFKPNAGVKFKFNGKDLRVLQHKEVLFSEIEEPSEAP